MCDDSCAQGGGGGTRRCYRHNNTRSSTQIRRPDARPGAAVSEEGRSVHQALCGGIVAGVLFGGVLGGVVVGAAAVGASIVSRRNRDRGDDGVHVVSCVSTAAAAAAATTAAVGRGGVSYGGVTTREEAMLATGRAIHATTTLTCAAALGRVGQGAMSDDDDGSGEDAVSLPSARPVASLVATPCTSRSIRRARRLTAVTATPATRSNNVVFAVPMHCTDNADGGDRNAAVPAPAPAAGGLTSGGAALAPPAAMVAAATGRGLNQFPDPGVSGGGTSGGEENSGDNNIANTARRWWTNNTTVGSGGGGGGGGVAAAVAVAGRGGAVEGGDDEEESDDEDEEGAEEEGEGWWAGEEFEGDWACLFEAYLPEGGGRRMPCLVAREPLQGSGVNVRYVRDILRIADWHDQGDLALDEFFLAMYLCRRHRVEGGVPSMLEAWMIPPSLRETRGCQDNSPCPAYPP